MISFFFYIFSFLIIASAVMVVLIPNPIYAVLCLILTFFISAPIFILLTAELIAMLMIIVYVGAISVLFLFVIMMLDIDYSQLRQRFVKYFAFGIVFVAIMFSSIYMIIKSQSNTAVNEMVVTTKQFNNTNAIGNLLYTKYMYAFHLSGVLLLLSIIGSITLTLHHKSDVKRQNVGKQLSASSTLKKVNVKIGEGVEWKL